jgi:hypothetical protein
MSACARGGIAIGDTCCRGLVDRGPHPPGAGSRLAQMHVVVQLDEWTFKKESWTVQAVIVLLKVGRNQSVSYERGRHRHAN